MVRLIIACLTFPSSLATRDYKNVVIGRGCLHKQSVQLNVLLNISSTENEPLHTCTEIALAKNRSLNPFVEMAGFFKNLFSGSPEDMIDGRHNLSLGTSTSKDVILYTENKHKDNKFMDTVSHTFSYKCKKGEEITAVLAEDQCKDDTGGNAELESGGVGHPHVAIKVTSRRNQGLHFKFTVYGKRMSGQHNLKLGTPASDDIVLYTEDKPKDSKFLNTVSHTFTYQCQNGEEITAVLAEDLANDDTGGNAELVDGGVGKELVSIKITSQRNCGFHFKFTVYGKRRLFQSVVASLTGKTASGKSNGGRTTSSQSKSGQSTGASVRSVLAAATPDNWQYTTLSKNSDKIIQALAANGLSERLASSFKAQGMIGDAVYANATNYGPGITEFTRVKCLIIAVQTSTRATPQRYHDLIKVLQARAIRADAEAALKLLPTRAPASPRTSPRASPRASPRH